MQKCQFYQTQASNPNGSKLPLALSQQFRRCAGQVDHGGRFDAAGTRIEHQIEHMLKARAISCSIVERQRVPPANSA